MDPNAGGHGPPDSLSRDSLLLFSEAVHLVLSQWTALRLAVENEWGGRNSRQKFEQLTPDVLSWFTSSKDTLYIDDLEAMLDEGMVSSFNAEIEDGSIEEEVAEQLMTVHEECLHGNFETLFKLRSFNSRGHGVSESRQVVEDSDDSSDEDEDPASEMEVEAVAASVGSASFPTSQIRIQNESNVVKQSHEHASNMQANINGEQSRDAADGWMVVTKKKNHGRKSR